MRIEFGSQPEDLIAAIGPGVGQCCYAVGEEVLSEFESQFSYARGLFREVFDSDPVRRRSTRCCFLHNARRGTRRLALHCILT